jgi:hypothetical protein
VSEDDDSWREGELRGDATPKELVDDWLHEHYGVGLATIERTFGDSEPAESRFDDCTSRTIRAVKPNEVTAGVDVARIDVDDRFEDIPFMVELRQYFPPEDDRDGDTVAMHGEHAVLQTISALSDVLADRFEEVPWDDV